MVFFINNDGTVANTFPSQVYQGSDSANRLLVIAPFAENLTAAVRFLLPNGVISRPYNMTYTGRLTGIADENGRAIFGWSMDLPSEISTYYGTVTAQFYFYAAGMIIKATSAASFTVGRGVPGLLPEEPSAGIYEEILSLVSTLQQDLGNGYYASRSVYAWNSSYRYGANELVFYPMGEYGVYVKSLTEDNGEEPYANGKISKSWSLVVDFNTVMKAAARGDIVLYDHSTDEEIDDAYSFAQKGYASRIFYSDGMDRMPLIYAPASTHQMNFFLTLCADGAVVGKNVILLKVSDSGGWERTVRNGEIDTDRLLKKENPSAVGSFELTDESGKKLVSVDSEVAGFTVPVYITADVGVTGSLGAENDPVEENDVVIKRYFDNNAAVSLDFSVDNSTFVLTATLKNANGEIIGTPQTVDLPLESVVVGGRYENETKSVVLTLQNGNTINIPVADLVEGLATTSDLKNYVKKSDIDSALSDTSVNPVQNKVIKSALDNMVLDNIVPNISPGLAFVAVASSEAPISIKSVCHYICDGVDDQIEIQNAITSIASTGGKVFLTKGKFFISSPIDTGNIVIELCGEGSVLDLHEDTINSSIRGGTILQAVGNTDILHIGGAKGSTVHDISFFGYGRNKADNTGFGIRFTGYADTDRIYNCGFTNCAVAIGSDIKTDILFIYNLNLQRNKIGIRFYSSYARIHDCFFCENIGMESVIWNNTSYTINCADICVMLSTSEIYNNTFYRSGMCFDVYNVYGNESGLESDEVKEISSIVLLRAARICRNFFRGLFYGNCIRVMSKTDFIYIEGNSFTKWGRTELLDESRKAAICFEKGSVLGVIMNNMFYSDSNTDKFTDKYAIYEISIGKDNDYWSYSNTYMNNFIGNLTGETTNKCVIVGTSVNNKFINNVVAKKHIDTSVIN